MTPLSFASENEVLLTTSEFESQREQLVEKLRQMLKLPMGWSHGEGLPVSEAAVTASEEFVLLAANMDLSADVFPNLDGGCAVAFYKGDDRVEVSVNSEGKRLGLRVERGIGFQFEDVVVPDNDATSETILNNLVELQMQNERGIWKLRVSSISDSSTAQVDDSATSYLGTPRNQITHRLLQMLEGGSQSLIPLVPARAKA